MPRQLYDEFHFLCTKLFASCPLLVFTCTIKCKICASTFDIAVYQAMNCARICP